MDLSSKIDAETATQQMVAIAVPSKMSPDPTRFRQGLFCSR
ncbi:hypothetical protein [[Leptolyngbya] sp. PCC 7376]|nr:hypothetical protein [[Leptolyngbya] sp. PCC 7376]